jgi:hypothetical protein
LIQFPVTSKPLSPGIVRGSFVPALVELQIARMSQLSQKLPKWAVQPMSALRPLATIERTSRHAGALSGDPLGADALVRCQNPYPRQTFYFLDLTWLQIALKFVFVFVSENNDCQFPNQTGFDDGASIF